MKQPERLDYPAYTAADGISTDTALGQMVARLASSSREDVAKAANESYYLLHSAADVLDCLTELSVLWRKGGACCANREKADSALETVSALVRLVADAQAVAEDAKDRKTGEKEKC